VVSTKSTQYSLVTKQKKKKKVECPGLLTTQIRSRLRNFSSDSSRRDKRIFSTGCAGRFGSGVGSALVIQVAVLGSVPRSLRKAPEHCELWSAIMHTHTTTKLSSNGVNGHSTILTRFTIGTEENTTLTDCYYEKKDWRACKDEVRCAVFPLPFPTLLSVPLTKSQMERFRQCWKVQGNDERTDTKDA
jgi:hypothetical protein